MFNPDLREVLEGSKSRYSLVTAVARRAREIAEDDILTSLCGTEKPVTFALDEFLTGNLQFEEAEELKADKARALALENGEELTAEEVEAVEAIEAMV